MTNADDKAKIAAISRDLETLLQEMAATREETRALIALTTRIAEKLEANLAELQRIRLGDPQAR